MKTVLKFLLTGIYFLIPFVPLLLLVGLPLPDSHTGRPFRDDLASALAMTGLAMIFMEFVVIGRIRTLSTLFGCDQVMRVHQLFARTATIFLVVHPFLYSLWGKASTGGQPSAQSLGIDAASLLTGVLAWGTLIVLVMLALHRHDPEKEYDRWRFWHAVLALLVIGFGLHHTLHAGLYASLPWIAGYWWALFALALGVNLLIYLLRPMMQRNCDYEVVSVMARAERTWQLTLRAAHNAVRYPAPGQFFWIKRNTPWTRQDHPFSVMQVSAGAKEISFLIKEAGDFTKTISSVTVGERFYLDGPYGDFQIPDRADTVLIVAGGIGVAPVIRLLSDCAARRDSRRILVVVATGSPALQVDLRALIDFSRCPGLHLVQVVEHSEPPWQGRVGQCDGVMVGQICDEFDIAVRHSGFHAMVCGPTAMADSIERELIQIGASLSAITTERYRYDLGEDSPVSKVSVRHWLMASVGMLGALVFLADRL